MATPTSNAAITEPCPQCGRHAARRPVRVNSHPAEPLPGFGEPGVRYTLVTYTVRCTACRHIWKTVDHQRTATKEAGR